MYPQVCVEEYPAEGGTLVACHGGITQSLLGPEPALLQPFCEVWKRYVACKGQHICHACCRDMSMMINAPKLGH